MRDLVILAKLGLALFLTTGRDGTPRIGGR